MKINADFIEFCEDPVSSFGLINACQMFYNEKLIFKSILVVSSQYSFCLCKQNYPEICTCHLMCKHIVN